ncbi:MAG: hypothetical protein R3293_06805 [Candidatus Promineifilaceae bacterium]|nr:hypothetical protein [Candidatus Promineifilaceae bacterium]
MNAVKIYEGQDFYVPYFQVKVANQPLGKGVINDAVQVSYSDNIDAFDKFDITFTNWDAQKRTFKYSDQDLFDPGKEVELWMGYYGQDRLRLMLKGEITSLRPDFPAGGQPSLVISGLNLLHRLRSQQESYAYENMTDSQIAKQIGQRLGIEVKTDAEAETQETEYKYLFQDNKYDIIFLMERARRIGYDLFVEETGDNGEAGESQLYFGPSQNVRQTAYELIYGRDLMQFKPDLTTANQVGEVTVRGWDAQNKQKIEATATRSDLNNQGVGEEGGQAAIEQSFNQRQEVITYPVESEAEARELALNTLDKIAKDMIKGSGSTVGLPDLRAGSVLMIGGLGKRFSGRYFVTNTTHSISDSGYTTTFDCRLENT